MGISFYCRQSKADRNGLSHIELSIVINGQRKFVNLPMKCSASEFNKRHRPEYIDDYLSEMRVRVNELQVEFLRKNIPLTPHNLSTYLKNGGFRPYTVGMLVSEWLGSYSKKGKPLTYRKYQNLSQLLLTYVHPDEEVTALTPTLMQRLSEDLYNKYEESTAGGMLTKIKTLIGYAVQIGKLDANPLNGIKIHRGRKPIEYLTEQELDLIRSKQLSIERLIRVRDLFLFQCSSGLSYSDLVEVRKEDIREGVIEKQRNKTGVTFTSVVLPEGLRIFDTYCGKLPTLSNQKYNSYLKELESICGLKKGLHTHLARKTYACRLLNSGVRLETVSRCLGHSNTRITEQVYATLRKSTIYEEVRSKF